MGAKIIIAILWLLCIVNLVMPFPGIAETIFFWLLVFLLVAHVIECAVFSKRVMKAEGSKLGHFLQVFLFGIVHANTLPK